MKENKPLSSLPARKVRQVRPGLGVDDIKHIPTKDRELRFTRNRLGAILTVVGVVLLMIAVFFQITGYDTITPYLLAPLWVMQLCAAIPALICLYAGWRCLRYAALIVTPLGLEVMPFFNARETMSWFVWQQIRTIELRDGMLILDIIEELPVNISLSGLTPNSRALLMHALEQRLSALKESGYGKA